MPLQTQKEVSDTLISGGHPPSGLVCRTRQGDRDVPQASDTEQGPLPPNLANLIQIERETFELLQTLGMGTHDVHTPQMLSGSSRGPPDLPRAPHLLYTVW